MIAKPEPHARVKARRKRQQAAADRAVYRAVTERDTSCRACGLWSEEMHRHHIRGRRYTTTADVCLLCAECHGLTHVRVGGKRLMISGNANERLTILRRRDDGTWIQEAWAA